MLQRCWTIEHHGPMNAYSGDLRRKIVEAIEHGMGKSEAARTFGVSLSSVKRYVAMVREGRSLIPKRRPGSKRKLDRSARRLLEANLEEHLAATLTQRREFLERVAGVRVNESTVSRMLKRLGWGRKKDRWVQASVMSGSERPGG
jgi:transposase